MNLFESTVSPNLRPLAERLRPKTIAEIIGQDHILNENQPIGKLLRHGHLINMIVTGPPGTGKTSFAKVLASTAKAHFISMNAVDAGVKDLKAAGEEGKNKISEFSEKTILFVDEIHRFNKAQQDVLLPFIERGDLYLIGATTEHPSYELNKALLSRCRVLQFKRLEKIDFIKLANKITELLKIDINHLLHDDVFDYLVGLADGDGRKFFNYFESVVDLFHLSKDRFPLSIEILQQLVGSKILAYDKSSEQHYDCISAFIKSIRGSDPDAALYYMARMLESGEDPIYIARRLVILSSEDIGNAEPRALPLAIAGLHAAEAIGLPECAINLSQVVTFLACCPKSNRSYMAWNRAKNFIFENENADIPLSLKSSEQKMGGYVYPHEFEKAYVEQNYWPRSIQPQVFYEPSQRGHEKIINDFLKWLKQK